MALLKDKYKSKKHQTFKDNEVKIFEKFHEKVEEVRQLARGGGSIPNADEEFRRLLAEKESQVQELLRQNEQL